MKKSVDRIRAAEVLHGQWGPMGVFKPGGLYKAVLEGDPPGWWGENRRQKSFVENRLRQGRYQDGKVKLFLFHFGHKVLRLKTMMPSVYMTCLWHSSSDYPPAALWGSSPLPWMDEAGLGTGQEGSGAGSFGGIVGTLEHFLFPLRCFHSP